MNVPLIQQLAELRSRCISVLVLWLIFFVLCALYSRQLYTLIAEPLLQLADASLIAVEVASPILIPLKLAAFVSFILIMPVFLYQLWGFIAPGLYQREKFIVFPLLLSSLLLFYLGIAFVYYVVLPLTLGFFHRIAPDNLGLMTDISHYFNFVIRFFIVFGLIFELPIAIFVLVRSRLVSIAHLRRGRRYVIVGCFILAMLLTPPDVFSQALLAIPMCLLYELGLLGARLDEKYKKPS